VFEGPSLSVCSPFPLGVPHELSRKSVSSPRRIKPTVRISRSGLSWLFPAKGYETFEAGWAFGNSPRPTR
jgi:hypothetical protein